MKTKRFWLSIKQIDKCLFSRRNGYVGWKVFNLSICIRLFGVNLHPVKKVAEDTNKKLWIDYDEWKIMLRHKEQAEDFYWAVHWRGMSIEDAYQLVYNKPYTNK